MYRVLELRTGRLLYENEKLDKAKNYAELYKKNMQKGSTIQKCETIWSTETLDEFIK
jgi:hypothetical protein